MMETAALPVRTAATAILVAAAVTETPRQPCANGQDALMPRQDEVHARLSALYVEAHAMCISRLYAPQSPNTILPIRRIPTNSPAPAADPSVGRRRATAS